MVHRIDNVGIATWDLEAMERFYGLLGFQVQGRDDTPGILLASGTARLYIFQVTQPAAQGERRPDLINNPVGLDHLSFWVGNVDEAYRQLRERGVRFATEPADQEWRARACSL